MKQNLGFLLLKILPRHLLSTFVGFLVSLKFPRPLASLVVRCFARYYKINLQEAELPIENYPSIQALFTRRLRPGVRPIRGSLVHPCDANITAHGRIEKGELIQAKGITYSLDALLGEDAKRFWGGHYITYYLCPTDYHRVHAPCDFSVEKTRHIPGDLWPVNEISVRKVPGLFAINERVVGFGNQGRTAMVMVGATNVGSIGLSFSAPAQLKTGDEFGVFNMGSTVILILDSSYPVDEIPSGPVLLGEELPQVDSH